MSIILQILKDTTGWSDMTFSLSVICLQI